MLSGFQANPATVRTCLIGGRPAPARPAVPRQIRLLYLVQHDVDDLAGELARRGYMLVVFVDDLDRCPPEAVAEVFEAVNIFLAENFANAKFVIGLDPSVVAHDLAVVFRAQESRLRDDPDDPNLGWSFLRKLCQCPLTLPAIREAHAARLMRNEQPSGRQPAAHPATLPPPSRPAAAQVALGRRGQVAMTSCPRRPNPPAASRSRMTTVVLAHAAKAPVRQPAIPTCCFSKLTR